MIQSSRRRGCVALQHHWIERVPVIEEAGARPPAPPRAASGHQDSAIALSVSGRAALSSSPSLSTNVMGTNRELSAGADSFDARRMTSILIRKISASIVLLLGRGPTS